MSSIKLTTQNYTTIRNRLNPHPLRSAQASLWNQGFYDGVLGLPQVSNFKDYLAGYKAGVPYTWE